jgi:hypothetical protein
MVGPNETVLTNWVRGEMNPVVAIALGELPGDCPMTFKPAL